MDLTLYVAGRCQANPTLASAAIVIHGSDDAPVYEAAYFLGQQTIEAAGYHGLLRGLEVAARRSPDALHILSADDFLVQHVTGQVLVANPALEMLHEQAQLLLLRFKRWSIRKTPEGAGRRAADLAVESLKQHASRVFLEADAAAYSAERHSYAAQPSVIVENPAGASETLVGERVVHLQMTSRPRDECPAGDWCPVLLTVSNTLPAGVCIHAAHAVAPTILAMFNSDAAEFASIPTLTVRCSRQGCPAKFHISPATAPQS